MWTRCRPQRCKIRRPAANFLGASSDPAACERCQSGGCRRVSSAVWPLPSSCHHQAVHVMTWGGFRMHYPGSPACGLALQSRMTTDSTAGAAAPGNEAQSGSRSLQSLGPRTCAGSGRRPRVPGVAAASEQSSGVGPGDETGINELDSARIRPSAAGSGLTQAATHAPPWGVSVTARQSPRGGSGRDSRVGRGQGSRQAVRPRFARPGPPVRMSDGTRGDTEPAPRRGRDHEVPYKGRAS